MLLNVSVIHLRLLLSNVLLYYYFLIHLPGDGHLDWFQFSSIMSEVVTGNFVQICLKVDIFIPTGQIPRIRNTGSSQGTCIKDQWTKTVG